ncbi:MAG: DUF4080 domain-containing protein, partial [Planctomycetaceae bacterium]
RYWHSAFGLRYLFATMGVLQDQTTMLEFGTGERTLDVLSAILQHEPQIVGIGVYIWNVEQVTKLVADLKRVRPQITVILGGPEVSYETDTQPVVALADYIITGEADLAFGSLCETLLNDQQQSSSGCRQNGRDGLPAIDGTQIIAAPLPQADQLVLPYDLYTAEDIAHRVIYVEASRGCPFSCEFCLSALDIPVRQVDLDAFLLSLQRLLDRGARQFKFVDRTFNLNLKVSRVILEFFLEQSETDLFLHFEMVPDRLPEPLRKLITQFPAGMLQFEIGVQTFNDQVGELISRRQDNAKLEENLVFLREQTGVHIHADLIVGLPGETVDSFGAGFDRLLALGPQEIQVGMLKRLRGTPIIRHDDEWQMTYSGEPPYEILSTSVIDFPTMQRLRRFSRFWDLIGNSGHFPETTRWILNRTGSAFESFLALCDWLFESEGKTHGIALQRLSEYLFKYLVTVHSCPEEIAAAVVWRDYTRGGRHDRPGFLRSFDLPHPEKRDQSSTAVPRRQSRHASLSQVESSNRRVEQ